MAVNDVTGSIELLGNPFSAAFPSGNSIYARNVWDIHVFNDRLYLGHGNSANAEPASNAGPVDVWYYDPGLGQFVNEFTVSEEQIDHYRTIGGQLYIPGHDPVNGSEHYYRLEGATWTLYSTIGNLTHNYDMIDFGGDLFASLGSNGDPLRLSQNGGASWLDISFVNDNPSFPVYFNSRIFQWFELNGTLYASGWVFLAETAIPTNWIRTHLMRYDGGTASTIVNKAIADEMFPGFQASVSVDLMRLVRPVNLGGELLYIGAATINDHQWDPRGLFKATDINQAQLITLPDGALPRDIHLAADNTAYVLGNIKVTDNQYIVTVNSSTDLVSWTEILRFDSDTFARSFDLHNGYFYFGLGCETTLLPASTGNILRVAAPAASGPEIDVTPTSVDFGGHDINAGPTAPMSVNIANIGTVALNFTGNGIEFGGANPAVFSFAGAPSTAPLAPATSRTVDIVFDPIANDPTSATLVITTDDADEPSVTVPLSGSGCSVQVSPLSQDFSAPIATGTIVVTAPAGCPWTAVSNDVWISIVAGAGGSGNGTVTYALDANTGLSRIGTISVTDQTVQISQGIAGDEDGNDSVILDELTAALLAFRTEESGSGGSGQSPQSSEPVPESLATPNQPSFSHTIIDNSGQLHNPHVKAMGDMDGDGFIDLIAGGGDFPGTFANDNVLAWYHYPTWQKIIIQSNDLYTTDMQAGDVDNDGDPDVIVPRYGGGNGKPKQLVWYENPRPSGDVFTGPWVEHVIGSVGSTHDVEIADIDQDGKLDIVSRLKGGGRTSVWFQDNPDAWTEKVVNTDVGEGTDIGDIDGDLNLDIAHNGFWLQAPIDPRNGVWVKQIIDINWPDDVGVRINDIDGNGSNDVILAPSESSNGRLSWYGAIDPINGPWTETIIDNSVSYFHTFQVYDMDLDGDLDIVTAEMHQSSDPDEISVYLNEDSIATSWKQVIVDTTGSHNIRVADIGNDGDFDIFGANWASIAANGAPIELWENRMADAVSLDNWTAHLIDGGTPWNMVFVDSADVDGDGKKDIIAGGWWFKNPGNPAGIWPRGDISAPLNNMAVVSDFDGDGDADILGTTGQHSSNIFVWGQNDGTGSFTIFNNLDPADGDFLQGVSIGQFDAGGPTRVALSWHTGNRGVQTFTAPADPTVGTWAWEVIHNNSQDEGLTGGDIDDDNDIDLFQGTKWLRNDTGSWTQFTASNNAGIPDRNRLGDIDGDGDLDAVVGFEGTSTDLIWLEAPTDPTQLWTEHTIATGVGGGFSLDVADMDNDGDLDVILGEHQGATRLIVYTNDGTGTTWISSLVDAGGAGIDHHDGSRAVDIDEDGDLDIISIGWYNDKVWLFENKSIDNAPSPTEPPTVPTGLTADSIGAYSVVLSWNASTDNIGVAGYNVYRDGVLVGTTAGTSWRDDGVLGSATYDYTVSAFDGDGNESAQSTVLQITTLVPPPPYQGIVADHSFYHGQGSVSYDSTSNMNDGNIDGAAWRTGYSGNGLGFDGIDDRVVIPNSASLDVDHVTVSAWIYVDGYRDFQQIVAKEAGTSQPFDLYSLLLTVPTATTHIEDIDLGGASFFNAGSSVTSGDFLFQSGGTIFIIDDPTACSGGCADNGTQTLVSLDGDGAAAGGPVTLTHVLGDPFRILEIDLAEGVASSPSFPPATSITLSGTLAAGGTIDEVIPLDGIIDSTGPAEDFESFALTTLAGSELVSVTISAVGGSPIGDGSFSIDNIIIALDPPRSDFDDLDLGGASFVSVGSSISSGELDFQSGGAIFIVDDPDACGGGCANSGSQTLISLDADGADAGGPITFNHSLGLPFRLIQMDLAEGIASSAEFPPATSITIVGTLSDGGTVSETFDLDGVIDASGPAVDFESFTMSTLANNDLISATINAQGGSPLGDGAFSIDNVVFTTPDIGAQKLEFRLGLDNQNRHRITSSADIPVNEWTHVTATFDGNQAMLLIDGQVDTIDNTISGVISDNNNQVTIGESEFYTRPFHGAMDEVKIFNRALAAPEVQTIMNNLNSADLNRDGFVDMSELNHVKLRYRGL